MLTRDQVYTLLMLRNRGDSVFTGDFAHLNGDSPFSLVHMPEKVINKIWHMVDPNSQIHSLLIHIVNARQETREAAVDPNHPIDDFAEIKKLLDADYSLLFQAADVMTPAGLIVKRVMPYEAALGSGDPVMAAFIAEYLKRTKEGRAQKARSDERYRPHIEKMLIREPYNVRWLVNIMIKASDQDVAAVINKTPDHSSALKDAVERYQRETLPGEITVGMHCNYNNLTHIINVYYEKFNDLESKNPNADNATKYSRHILFTRRVIGWEQGNLPAYERFVFVRGDSIPDRTYKWFNGDGSFPASRGRSRDHLGENYWVFDGMPTASAPVRWWASQRAAFLANHVSSKNSELGKVMRPESSRRFSPGCPIQ